MSTQDQVTINLVPQAHQEKRLRQRLTVRWCGAAAATIAFVGLPGIYIGGNAVLSDPAIGMQIEQISNQLGTNQATIPRLQSHLAQLQAEQEVLELVHNHIEWRTLFSHLVLASADKVRFTALNAVGGGIEGDEPIRVEIVGIAATQTAARSYVVALESLGLFDSIELTRTTRRDINDHEVIEFEIIAVVPSSRAPVEETP